MQKDPTHMQGTPEWLKFNQQRLIKAANTLTRLMGGAGLFPAAQERLRKIFKYATNTGGMVPPSGLRSNYRLRKLINTIRIIAAEYLAAGPGV